MHRIAPRGPLAQAGIAVVISVVAAGLSLMLRPFIPQTPSIVYFAAVGLSAWLGGRVGAATSIVLSTGFILYFNVDPERSFQLTGNGLLQLAVVVFISAIIALVVNNRRHFEAERERLLERERAVRAQAEAAEQQASFLADVAGLFAALDYEDALRSLARLAVPVMADWCIVDALDADGSLRRLAVEHADPGRQAYAREFLERYPRLAANAPHTLWKVLRPTKPWFDARVSDERLASEARDPEHLRLLRALGYKSEMVVPLVARGRTLGGMTFVRSDATRPYGPEHLAVAGELARRAALAADNARLLAEAQLLNAELEQRVVERTAQLEQKIVEHRQLQEDLVRSREELRQLSAHLQTAREQERARIAREIHDELGGNLTGLKMDVARLRRLASQLDREWLEQSDKISAAIDRTVETVRRIATELRPAILDDFGLVAAIEWQLREFEQRSGIACSLTSEVTAVDLPPEGATAVFRVFQETLTNVARHAQATRVDVLLSQYPEHLVLEVRDNGRGIQASDLTQARSFGLMSMRERVRILDGNLAISGQAGHGTTVQVKIPLAAADYENGSRPGGAAP
jgi:signal transduction histidine kinase